MYILFYWRRSLGFPRSSAGRLSKDWRRCGALEEHTDRENHGLSGGSGHYEISPLVLEITNQRKAKAKAWPVPIDHVSAVQRWARSHPVWSSLLTALLVLAASATFGRQLMGIFEKIGSLK